jgi:hypothetical protein
VGIEAHVSAGNSRELIQLARSWASAAIMRGDAEPMRKMLDTLVPDRI